MRASRWGSIHLELASGGRFLTSKGASSEGIKSGTLCTLGSSQLDSRRQLGLARQSPAVVAHIPLSTTMRYPVGIPVFEENSTMAQKKGQGSVRNGRASTSKARG